MIADQLHIDNAARWMLGDDSIKHPVIAVFRARDAEASRRAPSQHAGSLHVIEFVAERIRCRKIVLATGGVAGPDKQAGAPI